MEQQLSGNSPPKQSAWSPLRQPVFRALWIAGVASNIGTWMHEVGAAWLMTSLAPSPLMVALMQTATSLPIFLLALPAGALADIVDRRRLLIAAQLWMLAAAFLLGLITIMGAITPWLLVGLAFTLGLGGAMTMPAWQAIIPEMVPRSQLVAAVTLGGVGFNLARAAGPAVGGLIVAAAGPGSVFILNAVSFLGVVVILFRWRRPAGENMLPAERMMGAMRSGFRYVRYSPALRAVLARSCVFIVCGSALWALLPLLARRELGFGAVGYGALLGCLGAGAITGATALPPVRSKLTADQLVIGASLLFSAVLASLAVLHSFLPLCAVMFIGGMAWLALLSSFNSVAQTAVPAWVRGRALAVYLLVFFGGSAGGSVLWGTVALHTGIPAALLYAALGLVAGLAASVRYRLAGRVEEELAPSLHWPEPAVFYDPHPDRGPVLVTVEYRIDPSRSHDFVREMHVLRTLRRRDGATNWWLFSDTAEQGRYLECFLLESWIEHLRQHERVTKADLAVENRVRTFHVGAEPPRVSHLLYEPERPSAKIPG